MRQKRLLVILAILMVGLNLVVCGDGQVDTGETLERLEDAKNKAGEALDDAAEAAKKFAEWAALAGRDGLSAVESVKVYEECMSHDGYHQYCLQEVRDHFRERCLEHFDASQCYDRYK